MFRNTRHGWVAAVVGCFAALAGLSSAVAGQDAGVRINPFYGAFGTSIDIQVPSYHGLQPKISLQYDSNAPNGFVGMGWVLQADSAIERRGYRNSQPSWTASDGFVLDGMELVPCTSLGGTHCTKRQSYLRITQDTANNRWIVEDRDGTRATYTPLIAHGGSTFRWGLTSRTDASGAFTVNYSYQCYSPITVTQCYLDTITYNGNEIRFFREQRTDAVPSARNLPALGLMNFRLKSITVRVGGALARAYDVVYTSSFSSDRSIIWSLQECGRYSSVDLQTGAISCSTPMVPWRFDWYQGFNKFVTQSWPASYLPVTDSNDPSPWAAVGDFDGDGRTDYVVRVRGQENGAYKYVLGVWRPTAAGTVLGEAWTPHVALGEWGGTDSIWVGDFDGDGRSDVGTRRSDGSVLVFRSTGTGFQQSVWQAPSGAWSTPGYTSVGDVNGDGRDDILSVTSTNIHVHLSTGSAFVDQAPVATGALGPSSTTWFADFTGDKRMDIATAIGSTVYVKVSGGTTFTNQVWTTTVPANTFYSPEWNRIADVNGDGFADLVAIWPNGPNGIVSVLTSMGSSFSFSTNSNLGAFGAPGKTFVMDVDGDGRSDIASGEGTTLTVRRSVSAAGLAAFTMSSWAVTGGGTFNGMEVIVPGDFDGDRRPDILTLDYQSMSTVQVWRNLYDTVWFEGGQLVLGGATDVLRKITSPTLGSTKIEYKPSSAYVNLNNPPIMNTTYRTTTWDGRATTLPSVTTYEFSGGSYDRFEDQFLGFLTVRENLPCANGEWQCPYTVSTFYQDYPRSGRLQQRNVYRGDGALLASEQRTYTTNGGQIPYECQDASTMRYEYLAGTSAYRRTYVTRVYDAIGNLATETEWGDYDVAGDERTTQHVYRPNTSKYLVNLPARTLTYAGTSAGGPLLKEIITQFDGNPTWDAPPTNGWPTKVLHYDTVTGSYVAAEMGYDAWGNVVWQKDHLGRQTSFAYDAATRLFPVSTTNAAGMTATQVFDPVCEKITSSTDEGGRTKTTQYDGLCRVTRVDAPGGAYTTTSYVDGTWNMTADTQYVEVRQNPANATDGELWSRSYFDGLGRTWREESSGPTAGGPTIRAEAYFDARGNQHMSSAPHYSNEYGPIAITDFDALNRPVRITLPDQAVRTMVYAPGEVVATDELGKQMRRRLDGLGREVEHAELVGGAWRSVATTYNLRDDVVAISDPLGNQWAFLHDSLGRRLQISDPDKGLTSYAYDAASQLTTTIDAKGQRIERTYDVLGRAATRTTRFASGAIERTVANTYDEVRPGYSNVGRLTTVTVDGAAPVTYDYLEGGQVTRVARSIDGNAWEIVRSYDPGGRLLSSFARRNGVIVNATGKFGTAMGYDGAGRVKTIPGYVSGATYTASGALSTYVNDNGTYVVRAHAASRGWLNSVTTYRDVGDDVYTQIHRVSYTRNLAGLITGTTGNLGQSDAWTYAYDDARQLTSAVNSGLPALSQTFTYDTIGNLTSQTGVGSYAYPGVGAVRPHAVTQAGANTYAYDANGNLTSGAGRSITWSVENLPLTINGETYTYDADGSRIKTQGPAGTTITLGDDLQEHNGVVTQYVELAGVLVAKRVDGAKFWLHCDGLGSVRAITDQAGNIVQRLTYLAYTETGTAMATPNDPRMAAGQRRDATGLYYLHARYYDPVLGRFISADPTAPSDRVIGLNRYAYAANDPINNADVDGLGFFTSLLTTLGTAFNWIGQAIMVIKSCITFINNAERYGFWNAVVIKLAESLVIGFTIITAFFPVALPVYVVVVTALTVIKDTIIGLAQGRTLKEAFGVATQWTNLIMTAANAYATAEGFQKSVAKHGRAEAAKSLNPFRDPGRGAATAKSVPKQLEDAVAGAQESTRKYLGDNSSPIRKFLGAETADSLLKVSEKALDKLCGMTSRWWVQAAFVLSKAWKMSSEFRAVLNHMDDLVELYTKPQAMVNLSAWGAKDWVGFAVNVYQTVR